MKDRCTFSCFP